MTRQHVQQDNHDDQRRYLADFKTDIERNQDWQQAIVSQAQVLQPGRKHQAVKQPENEHSGFLVRGFTEQRLETIQIIETLVRDGQPDDRVNKNALTFRSSSTPVTSVIECPSANRLTNTAMLRISRR